MKQRVAVVDYGLCNLDSVRRALQECGAEVTVTDEPRDLRKADRLVLPGVGSFGDAMVALRERGLDQALSEEVDAGAPILGICLGMQLMADRGEEGGDVEGLGWISGTVRRLVPDARDRRVPHIGWNELDPVCPSPLLADLAPGSDFYFVHSYWFDCAPDDAAALTPYCGGVTAVVQRDNLYGVQFHPEKSHHFGAQLLKNFAEL